LTLLLSGSDDLLEVSNRETIEERNDRRSRLCEWRAITIRTARNAKERNKSLSQRLVVGEADQGSTFYRLFANSGVGNRAYAVNAPKRGLCLGCHHETPGTFRQAGSDRRAESVRIGEGG
jgi:hypothetical protein